MRTRLTNAGVPNLLGENALHAPGRMGAGHRPDQPGRPFVAPAPLSLLVPPG